MQILMMTNTYAPHVSGVAKSVKAFAEEYRKAGHEVLVVAPEFEGRDENEQDVVRIPAIQNFNRSDLSVRLPIPGLLTPRIEEFRPEVVHSHHPFLMGDTALRLACSYRIPLVFTHHTMYEQQTHYVPGDSEALKRFVISLATGYANLCDHVIAPSESIADTLRERGVETPITVVPTGIQLKTFEHGDGAAMRRKGSISPTAFVAGFVGRLAVEKNLDFLGRAMAEAAGRNPDIHFLAIGRGDMADHLEVLFRERDVDEQLHLTGVLRGQSLVDAYHAMDLFVFASKSETQGMVLAEAMAAGVPVVALDAPGVREVLRDGVNGRLLENEDEGAFAAAVDEMAHLPAARREQVENGARETARDFDLPVTAKRVLAVYESVRDSEFRPRDPEQSLWSRAIGFLKAEWDILGNVTDSMRQALGSGEIE